MYQLPAFKYDFTKTYRHRDAMDRVLTVPMDDRYLNPVDGHLEELHVQVTDQLYDSQGDRISGSFHPFWAPIFSIIELFLKTEAVFGHVYSYPPLTYQLTKASSH